MQKLKKAMFWSVKDKKKHLVQCGLCARKCIIVPGASGFCAVRRNVSGTLRSLVYEKALGFNIDPIEKKPLYHFHPGSQTFSLCTAGCNLACKHCQNWFDSKEFDHIEIPGERLPKEKVIELARRTAGISWTYTEPTVFYEYFYDTAKLAHRVAPELYQTWVSNGYTTSEAIRKAAKLLDAVNVDYKGDDVFYQNVCSARLEPVQNALLEMKKAKIWLEITNLLIPGYNDKPEQIKEMVLWIADNLGHDVPLHFSQFHPDYKLRDAPVTPVHSLEKAAELAKKHLNYVYIGNVQHKLGNTFCHNCSALLIERRGYVIINKMSDNRCPNCGQKIPGVFG